MEEWRTSLTLPEYEVSNLGRVRRLPYTAPLPKGGVRSYGGQAHFGQWDGRRRIFVFRHHSYRVHVLVCEAFNGLKPFPAAVVCHKDENGDNNRADNLQWQTQKENMNYPGYKEYARKTCRAKMIGETSF